MDFVDRVKKQFADIIQTKIISADRLPPVIARAGELLANCLLSGKKILICGNGGSAADSQHFSAELLNRFESERPSLPAIALTTDTSTLTSIANDYNFNEVFAKQIKGLGHQGDTLFVITTSGNSGNILSAVVTAQQRGMSVIALTGKNGGELSSLLHANDIEIRVPGDVTSRIQETHLVILHCLCDLIDYRLFGQG